MVNITLYQFDKRENSTLRPNIGTKRQDISGEIKEPFNIINPFIVIYADKYNPFQYNYVYIGAPLNKYYFVKRWNFDKGRYFGECAIDVLGTYRDSIRDSQQYIVRCSTKFNTAIIDNAYPILPQVYTNFYYSDVGLLPYTTDITQGAFIIGVNNNQMDNKFGSTEFYMLDYNAIRSHTASLFGSVDWLNVEDISNNLMKTLFNPFQYYNVCYWVPLRFDDIKPQNKESTPIINFGFWSQSFPDDVHYHAYPLNIQDHENGYTFNMRFPIPKHPQYNRGKCYGSAQYNNYTLLLQPFGMVDIDADMLVGHKNIVVNIVIDLFSRKAKIEIMTTDDDTSTSGALIGLQFCQNFGIDIPMGSVTINSTDPNRIILPTATNKLMKAEQWLGVSDSRVDILGGNYKIESITKNVGSNMAALQSNGATLATAGSIGSQIIYNMAATLMHRYRMVASENIQEIGRPLMQRMLLENVTGYIQCDHPDTWNIPATYEEKELVKMYLQSGIHIEV